MYRNDTSKEYTEIASEQIRPSAGRVSSSLKVVRWVGQVRIRAFPEFGLAELVPNLLARFPIQLKKSQTRFAPAMFWITFWLGAQC
jgi:hypothetical protein